MIYDAVEVCTQSVASREIAKLNSMQEKRSRWHGSFEIYAAVQIQTYISPDQVNSKDAINFEIFDFTPSVWR